MKVKLLCKHRIKLAIKDFQNFFTVMFSIRTKNLNLVFDSFDPATSYHQTETNIFFEIKYYLVLYVIEDKALIFGFETT